MHSLQPVILFSAAPTYQNPDILVCIWQSYELGKGLPHPCGAVIPSLHRLDSSATSGRCLHITTISEMKGASMGAGTGVI